MRTSAATAKINRMTSIPPARFGWKIAAEPTRPIGGKHSRPKLMHFYFGGGCDNTWQRKLLAAFLTLE